LKSAIHGADVVVDLVGMQGGENVSGAALRLSNFEATRELAQAGGSTARFVLLSSVRVYGVGHVGVITEDTPPRPNTEYGRTKLAAEELVRRELGEGAVVLRLSETYGPGDRRSMIFKTLERLRAHASFWVGRGENHFQPCYIDDAVTAIARATVAAVSGCLLVAGSESITVRDFLAMAAEILGVKTPSIMIPAPLALAVARLLGVLRVVGVRPPLTASRVYALCDDRVYNLSRALVVIGYKASTGLREGLSQTIAARGPSA
jgi:nucleoside-diphosphate-sugar epimerase